MAIIIKKALLKERKIPLLAGTSVTFSSFGFADYKEAEAWAQRRARDSLTGAQAASLAGDEFYDQEPALHDRLIGLAEEMLLDRLVMKYGTEWKGFLDEQKEPLPFNAENWELVKAELPVLCDILSRNLQTPMHMIVSEGNVSPPLPDTAPAVA